MLKNELGVVGYTIKAKFLTRCICIFKENKKIINKKKMFLRKYNLKTIIFINIVWIILH